MKTLILFVGWCILLVLCWPAALLALVLFPVIWLAAMLLWLVFLPIRLAFAMIAAVFALIGAVLFLPARLLGWRRC